jgi:hypothetical protein
VRAELSDDVSVTRKQGKPTLRAKSNLDWMMRFGLGLVFLVVYVAITLKLLAGREIASLWLALEQLS